MYIFSNNFLKKNDRSDLCMNYMYATRLFFNISDFYLEFFPHTYITTKDFASDTFLLNDYS